MGSTPEDHKYPLLSEGLAGVTHLLLSIWTFRAELGYKG